MSNWTEEGIWNACFGPEESPVDVVRAADSQSITIQDYAHSCVLAAIDQGADFDADRAGDVLLATLSRECPDAFAPLTE